MTVGSLFSGIGGIDLGLQRAGMTIAWQVEKDDWCRNVLTKHWPTVPKYDDITTLRAGDLEPVDLLCGGFPCQPVSSAGKRLAQSDQRWLWPEFARVIRALRPCHVLVENVSDLLARGFGDVLGDLAGIGYRTEWACIPAAAFGLPQRRWRVFIVADLDGWGCEERKKCDGARPHYFGRLNSYRLVQAEYRAREAAGIVCGMDARVPGTVDRLRGLGNAVVPQVVEWIGRRIIERETLQ